jgi:hypothetical protein
MASALASALQQNGWSVWWDVEIPPGRMFDEAIAGALKTAKCMIVLWSKSSVSSAWVKDEASEGKRRGILIPAVIDDNVDIPFGFRSLQVVRLTAWQGHPDSAFRALTGAIISLLEEANKAESRAEPGAREALADISGDHLYRDPTTRLIWTAKCSQKPMDWHEAKEYAKQLRIGGFSDWRLPTVDELEELHDHLGRVKYMVPKPLQLVSFDIWSSTKKRGADAAWYYEFYYGRRKSCQLNKCGAHALCVRDSEDLMVRI